MNLTTMIASTVRGLCMMFLLGMPFFMRAAAQPRISIP